MVPRAQMPAEVIAWFKKKKKSFTMQLQTTERKLSYHIMLYHNYFTAKQYYFVLLAFNLQCFCPAVSLLLFD